MRIISIFIILLSLAFSAKQEKPEPKSVAGLVHPLEKVYLHLDKTIYRAGEELWFKAYLVDANTHKPETLSKVVYVDLINPDNQIIDSKILRMGETGGEGDFKLSDNLSGGEYTIRAYTNLMRNFDEKWYINKKIIVKALISNHIANRELSAQKYSNLKSDTDQVVHKPDVQFFPDGGFLVDSLVNQVGIKAVGQNGKGMDISGSVFDRLGAKVLDFQTEKFGLGMFKFVPEAGNRYSATVTVNGSIFTYELPESFAKGVVMQVIEQKDAYAIVINSTLPSGIKGFKLTGRQRDNLVGSSEILGEVNGAKVVIQKNILKQGIAQFTLFDNNGSPLCERLVFVESKESCPIVKIGTTKKSYEKKELIELAISSDQIGSQKPNANMSISVVGISDSLSDHYRQDIKSFLLLNSELKGEIEHPGYYLFSDDPHRKKVLDLLMMTQGWRQFILNDTLIVKGDQKFLPETGIRFSGTVRRFNEEGKPAKANVSLIYSNNLEDVYNETTTDDHGHFEFDSFDFMDSTSIIIQAKSRTRSTKNEDIKNPNKNFYIVMDSLPVPGMSAHKILANQSIGTANDSSSSSARTDDFADPPFQTQKGDILIGDVLVSARKIDKDAAKRSMYFEPSNHLDFKELRSTGARNILEAIDGRIPGVSIDGEKIVIRGIRSVSGGSEPLFLLDGMPVSMSTILSFPVDNIDYIDLLKGSKTIIYGSSGSKGVIAVYSLNAADLLKNTAENKASGILNINHPGYSKSRKFYEPVYSSEKSLKEGFESGSTVYWNPNLKFGESDTLKISFSTADLPAVYKVNLEGITTDGIPLHAETSVKVK
ncbi:MAG: TonB-dependent receptor plug domain-containing protein [Mariniphaga sp.]